ncbi:CTP synthase 2-like [Planococcus citri]|uniref:CTP synthase 2-like n=1 Tax=Planococcus citri TaxID=170843 RepID=UPI0031F8115E
MKYILVTGGVISGVGKGIIASSFGTILKSCGLCVTVIKIDPYINIDAGTFSPYEHGEVYVLEDGSEVDLDLGNYERFLDATLYNENNITTGKIYQKVINRERKGEYLGKTVQVVPHITDAIQEWVLNVTKKPIYNDGRQPEVCIIELGGTIGDIEGMPFVEAFRQFQFKVGRDNFCLVHVSLVPQPNATGEHKTKPTQSSVRELRSLGLSPDIIVSRSETPINRDTQEKISNFCHVRPEEVICIHDLSSIYKVPVLMESQGIVQLFSSKLNLDIMRFPKSPEFMQQWKELAFKVEKLRDEVNIALVGKYTKLQDSYASVSRSLQHASIFAGYKLKLIYIDAENLEESMKDENPLNYHEAWKNLCNSQGVVVPGGFGKRGIQGKIAACNWCRKKKIPFLGICLGLQAAVIEFTKNVLNKEDIAESAEFKNDEIPTTEQPSKQSDNESKSEAKSKEVSSSSEKEYIIIDMPEHNTGQMGGTMRLGKKKTFFQKEHWNDSILYALYNRKQVVEERHRHRYEVNNKFVKELEKHGLRFVGKDENKVRMEMLELKDHPYYVATQFHPEYTSRPLRPSPPFIGLILASCGKLNSYISKGRLSPTDLSSSDEDIKS